MWKEDEQEDGNVYGEDYWSWGKKNQKISNIEDERNQVWYLITYYDDDNSKQYLNPKEM